MNMPFSLFLAVKYLKPKRTFLSVVTVISILGVTLGVAVLIIVLSVMTGFDDMWRDKILGFNAHITVTSAGTMLDSDAVIEEILTVAGVEGAAPFVQGLAFIQRGDQLFTPYLRGIDPEREASISRIRENMKAGEFSVRDDEVLMGRDLAVQLGVGVGDTVLVYSPRQFARPDEFHLPEELTVSGLFDIGMWDFDIGYVLTSMNTARHLNGMEEGVHGIQIRTDDPYRVERVAEAVRDTVGFAHSVRTWKDMNRQLFAALRVEKNMMFFLLIFITIVAAFSIMNTLITVTVQKTHEIGLLKSLGYTSGAVMRIFLWQGWISGALGIAAGHALGLWIVHYRNHLMRFLDRRLQMEIFPKELYRLAEIPASVNVSDLLAVTLTVMVICTLAGIVPAWRAAKLDPARALRYE